VWALGFQARVFGFMVYRMHVVASLEWHHLAAVVACGALLDANWVAAHPEQTLCVLDSNCA